MTGIRHLHIEEIDCWLDFLCRDIFPNDPRDVVEGMWTHDRNQDIRGVFAAFDPAGRIIASAMVSCMEISLLGQSVRAGILCGVGTSPSHRGKGLTHRLLEKCTAYARENHAPLLHLYSKPDSLEFYQKMGFMALPMRPDEDFYRMYKVISPFTLGDMPIFDTQTLIDKGAALCAP